MLILHPILNNTKDQKQIQSIKGLKEMKKNQLIEVFTPILFFSITSNVSSIYQYLYDNDVETSNKDEWM